MLSKPCSDVIVCLFVQYDVREDEEQDVKLKESINLLLAAGYFRARIKGLTPFDKVPWTYLSVHTRIHMYHLSCSVVEKSRLIVCGGQGNVHL